VISVTPWFVAAGAKAQMQKAYGEGEEYFTWKTSWCYFCLCWISCSCILGNIPSLSASD
jgi:hypothetical protein